MKTNKLLLTRCTMETTSWLFVIISIFLVHTTDFSNCAPTATEINSPDNDHAAGIFPKASIAPATMTPPPSSSSPSTTTTSSTPTSRTIPMNSAKSWASLKPSRSKHITKSNVYKKPSPKDKGGRAKVPFPSPTIVPTTTTTGYDVEKNISRHKEATPTGAPAITTELSTTPDTVVDNVNSPKDYSNKNTTNTSALRHFDSQHSSLGVSDILSTNANDDGASGKDIDFISDSRTTKADETHATTEGYHAKAPAARASSTTTMPASRVENPLSTMAAIPIELGVVKSMNSSSSDSSPTYHQSKSMPVNASVSFPSSSTAIMTTTTTTVSPTPSPKQPDVGHDGVKVTKKKQLFDKHFIAASVSPLGSVHFSLQRKDNPWPMLSSSSPTSTLSKTKPTKSNIGGGKKLMEVPNGYLGPIMMKEKTFSVSHPGKKPKPSLVEQKLKDKKLVEIIAPTALMEPISKVKNSQPDFVAIDVTTVASTTTTAAATTTEKFNTSIDSTTVDKNKKKEVESETATTYFLVVTQDGQAISNEKTVSPSVNREMEPLNSGETENTLREIYAEVINAMESGSRARVTSTEATTTVSNAPLSTTSQKNAISSDGSSPFDQEGTPETLHIFEQNFEKQTISSTVNPPIDESTIAIEDFTLSATNIEQKSEIVKLPKDLTKTEGNHEGEDHTALPKTASTLPKLEQSDISPLTVTKSQELVSSIETETGTTFSVTTKKSVSSEVSTVQKNVGSTKFYTTQSSAIDKMVGSTLLGSEKTNQQTQSEPILLEATTTKNVGLDTSTSSTTDRSLEDHSTAGLEISVVQGSSLRTTELSSTTMIPHLSTNQVSEPAESKISNIRIEVVDSTLQPIVAATNFKHNHPTAKHSPTREHTQERFTQYIVDKSTDSATQESSSASRAPGKPEPAAIEIHINVSEGFGNESEDLEFLYRQSDFRKFPSKKLPNSLKPPFDTVAVAPQNETSNEAAEEIVVEIIDTNTNSTENSGSRESLNVNPVFTFRSDDDSQVELKNVKYYPEDRPNNIKDSLKSSDDFFVPHVGEPSSSSSSSSGGQKPLMDRDSDTIFYISNTEVKVGESLPTANIYDTQMKKSRLESQFFPANYEEHRNQPIPQRYEEDIILSPSPSKNGPLKVIRRPLDISYVGESIMEVEQVTLTSTVPAPPPEPDAGSTPDVIIEPAVLPEMAIGVPVIGELPPQIELKEIDYMPNFDGNKEESSIQYGGDLIDEGGAMGVGFDMDSYPLGNLGGMGGNRDSVAISSQMLFNHRVNHLKKDVFSADVGGVSSSESIGDGNDLLRQGNDSVVNGTAGNATAYSVFEDQIALNEIMHLLTPRTLLFVGIYTIIPLVLVIFLIYIWRDYNRKYKRNPFNAMGRNSSTDPLDAEKGNGGGDGDGDGLETPEELRASSLAFGGATTTNTPSLDICTDSNEATNGNASDGDGRNCNGSNSNSRTASDAMDLGEIKAYNSGDVHGENFTLTTVRCYNNNVSPPKNQQKQQSISSNIPPQSTTTTNAAADTAVSGSAHSAAHTSSMAGSSNGTKHSNNYSGPNGSITTMTLKNNHLIVETEERNDISRDTRVTKMHYNNSEKDGVFVVEVSRGADSKIMPSSPVTDDKRPFNIDADVKIVQSDTQALLPNHEKVQVHAPPPENLINHDDIDTNHLHQIDEVDEFEECPKFTKNSNTGLSQSDLSSSSSVDSNKRYSYGNQELYTIEQQDYTTPSPVATKAPHPHGESKHPQPENHNDDNGHAENGGHCLEKSPTKPTPKCADSSITPPPPPLQSSSSLSLSASSDKVHDVNGQQDRDIAVVVAVESKPKITAALLKQDTVVVNEVTNGLSHVINGNNEVTPQTPPAAAVTDAVMDTNMSTEPFAVEIKTLPDYNSSNGGGINTENGFDSIISLPDPPSSDEIKQMNDIILMETNQLDSLPPPPPPENNNQHQHLNGNANGLSSIPFVGIENQNGDSHSIVSESPTMQTPTKVMKPLVPPTITVADTSATTDIPVHTNGNCLTGHPTTAIAVEVSGSS